MRIPVINSICKAFLKKYHTALKNVTYAIIDVDPNNHWVADLDHEDRNTAKSCQMCSIYKDIQRTSSPGWDDQPTPAGYSCQWKIRY